ncbi:spore germination protein [Psychrobacillus sp. FJAT-51614]|uniref:Spore germination protein n=1 Tax=Psychrobacillus mangrovi TaxID=3117745 RepID=A0ABU8F1M0_9BACI
MFRKKHKKQTFVLNTLIEDNKEPKVTSGKIFSSSKSDFIEAIKHKTHSPSDLIVKTISPTITVVYVDNIVDNQSLNKLIIHSLNQINNESPEIIKDILSIAEVDITVDIDKSVLAMLNGNVLIHVEGYSRIVVAKISSYEARSLTTPENESQVIGSQVGFNEDISTSISLVRKYILNPDLCIEKFTLGAQTNTTLSLLYIKNIAAEEKVNTLRQRIESINIDALLDSAVLAELIDDNSLTIFPQMLLTERPDRFCDGLLNGKLGIIVNGSSMAILCPYAFVEFFQSREDQNLRWFLATFIRILRFSAVFLSVYLTPIYVASLTFHYEVIPQPLLVPLSESRALVPFPPILEALILEFFIELLREAGARLPTKVGQTIGIVGGIVIGTAAVQAGITSNILIIIIALSALASFTTPSYMMGNVIRVLRFPIIIIAGIWGYYGIMLAFCLILVHLLRQSSLGSPYSAPFYPPRMIDWRDSIARLPMPLISNRPKDTRTKNQDKFKTEPVKPEKLDKLKVNE